MTKADFYIGSNKDARWIGSLPHDGYPVDGHVSAEIFLQVNKIMFEEMVMSILAKFDGIIPDRGDVWPWIWQDSRCTDYAYMFDKKLNKVIASEMGKEFFDPIKIIQGEGMRRANLGIGIPEFPQMQH